MLLLKDQWCTRRCNRVPLTQFVVDLVDQDPWRAERRALSILCDEFSSIHLTTFPAIHSVTFAKESSRSSPLLLRAVTNGREQNEPTKLRQIASFVERNLERGFCTRVASSFLSFALLFSLLFPFFSTRNSPGRKKVRSRGFDDSVKLTAQIRQPCKNACLYLEFVFLRLNVSCFFNLFFHTGCYI